MDIGTVIREARKAQGVTQIELAQAVGMAVNSIRLYEAGKRIPGLSQRLKIADALDCSPRDLLTDSELEAFNEAWEIGYWSREEETREEFELALTEIQARKDDPLYANMIAAYRRLNADGQREAVRHVEIIAGNPIYQRTSPAEPQANNESITHTTTQEKPSEN